MRRGLAARLARLRGSVDDTRGEAEVIAALQAAAKRAEQQLSTEAERLRRYQRSAHEDTVGGIPADSEYIIFVIDTSGSMQNYSWPKVHPARSRKLSTCIRRSGVSRS